MDNFSLKNLTVEEKEAFYQSKYDYYRVFNTGLIIVSVLAYFSFFFTDCGIFGRFAKERSKDGTVETFDFLGFTHYCGKSKRGQFRVKRKTAKKKLNKSIQEFKIWIKNNRNLRVTTIIKMLNIKLRGYYQYYRITDNGESLNKFLYCVKRILWKWINRRSQRRSYTSLEFTQILRDYPLIRPKIYVNIYDI